MTLFTYEASDKEGVLVQGELDAANERAIVEFLEKRNLIPVTIYEKGKAGRRKGLKSAPFEHVTALDRIILVRNLAASIRAGLNIVEALDILAMDAKKNILRNILLQTKTNLQNGQPLSATFAAYPKIFPIVFVGMIKAGEASGQLGETLEELGRHLTKEYSLTKKVRSALAYPILLFFGALGVSSLLMFFILPRIAKTFQQSGAELPLFTRIMIKISEIVTAYPIVDIFVIAGVVWFLVWFRKTALGRRWIWEALFRVPIASELIKKVALVRFTRTLGSLIASGTSILEALRLSSEAVSNDYYKKAVLQSAEQMKGGVALSQTLEQYPYLFPHFLTSLVLIGEKTGTLEHTLKTFADFYDEEVDYALKDLVVFLEPVILLFMGLLIGSVAASILVPIYQLVSQIG